MNYKQELVDAVRGLTVKFHDQIVFGEEDIRVPCLDVALQLERFLGYVEGLIGFKSHESD